MPLTLMYKAFKSIADCYTFFVLLQGLLRVITVVEAGSWKGIAKPVILLQ